MNFRHLSCRFVTGSCEKVAWAVCASHKTPSVKELGTVSKNNLKWLHGEIVYCVARTSVML